MALRNVSENSATPIIHEHRVAVWKQRRDEGYVSHCALIRWLLLTGGGLHRNRGMHGRRSFVEGCVLDPVLSEERFESFTGFGPAFLNEDMLDYLNCHLRF